MFITLSIPGVLTQYFQQYETTSWFMFSEDCDIHSVRLKRHLLWESRAYCYFTYDAEDEPGKKHILCLVGVFNRHKRER